MHRRAPVREVIVVGAGISGLAAAFRLQRAGLDVAVLEARDRVGGRTWRFRVGGVPFDAGGEVLDHDHSALLGLAEEVGLAVVEHAGWPSELGPDLDGDDRALYEAFDAEVARLAARVDPERPEELEGAWELDRQTLAGWLAERGASPVVLAAAETWISSSTSTVSTTEMSLLAYATKLAAGAAPTGLRLRLAGGPSALSERLAGELAGRVRLTVPVAALDQGEDGVDVRLVDGERLRARDVVLAMPLTLQRELRFAPPLPEHRLRALAEATYGSARKEAALFAEPPMLAAPTVTSEGVVYVSDEDPRMLVRFAGAGAASRRLDFAAFAGVSPTSTASVDWTAERWSRGSYLILGPGHLTTWARRLGEPHGRIHFAGAERSALRSYMEGAARGGLDAAVEILAASG